MTKLAGASLSAPPRSTRTEPQVRAPVAVIVSRFPLVEETFILREIVEMERQGQPVLLVPLVREYPLTVHREAQPWVRRALDTPFVSQAIVAANVRALLREPRRYLGTLTRVLVGSLHSVNAFTGTLGIFPKAVYLAERLRREGVSHVHAHVATQPTMVAYVIHRLAGIGYSFTAHADDPVLHGRRAMWREKVRRARFVRVISDDVPLVEAVGRLLEQISSDVAHVFPAVRELIREGALPADVLGVRRVHLRRASLVAELLVGGRAGASDAIVKVHRDIDDARRAAAARTLHECRALGEVAAALTLHDGIFANAPEAVRQLRVPAVLAIDETRGMVLLERCRGETLASLIPRSERNADAASELYGALGDAGRWLRAMQEHATPGDGPKDALDALVARAAMDLKCCTRVGLNDRTERRAQLALEELAVLAIEASPPAVARHGDYRPENVFVDDDAIQVIDFEHFGRGLAYEDVAWFLLHLELARGWRHLRSGLPAARHAFLQGWLGSASLDAEMLTLCRLTSAAHLMATHPAAATGIARTLRRRMLCRTIADCVRAGFRP